MGIAAVLVFYKGDPSLFVNHFTPLTEIGFFSAYGSIPLAHYFTYAFLVILTITGIIHFIRTSYNDKIRTRQLYYSIMFFDIVVLVLLALFPQYYDFLFRPAIILTSPLIGHFIALTNTKVTNIAFYIILATALFYVVQVVDANVFAYMQDFEMDDDISLRVEPTVITPEFASAPGLGLGLTLRF